jgi:hypothetical protein
MQKMQNAKDTFADWRQGLKCPGSRDNQCDDVLWATASE